MEMNLNTLAPSTETRSIVVDGKMLFLRLIQMGPDEGLLVSQAAEIYGVDESTIFHHLRNYGFWSCKICRTNLKILKEQGVIKSKVNKASFLPRETLRGLAKVINTDRAWAVYRQLWNLADRAYEFHQNEQARRSNADRLLDRQREELNSIKGEMQTIKQRIDSVPWQVKAQVLEVLNQEEEFPDDCKRLEEVRREYFPGISANKVAEFLKLVRHPRGYHKIVTPTGYPMLSRPFKRDGLDEQADRFFGELRLLSETDRNYIWVHPRLGKLFQDKMVLAVS